MKEEYSSYKIKDTIAVRNIVTIHYFEFDKSFSHSGEKHNFWEFVYIDKGEAIVNQAGKKAVLKQGQCIFHKPDVFHSIAADGINAPNVFIVSFECHSPDINYFGDKVITVPRDIRPIIGRIREEGENAFSLPFNNPDMKKLVPNEKTRLGAEQLVKLYLEQFLVLLLRRERDINTYEDVMYSGNADEKLSRKMQMLLDRMVYKPRVPVDKICKKIGYSRAYLSRIFKNNMGCSITKYVDEIKVREAKKLIREGSYNIAQISELLCYSNPLYFSRVFRRTAGMSPTEYRDTVCTK